MKKYLNPFNYYRKIQYIILKILLYKLLLKQSNKQNVFLFGVPMHNNLGDQAIVYAQLQFLNNVLPNAEIKIIYEGLYASAIKSINKKLKLNDIIAIQGGGNMGDIWKSYEIERENIVHEFADVHNKIISFPQSYSFTNTTEGLALKERAHTIYSQPQNLILFARERLSFNKMSHNFETKQNIELVPDIVLSLNKRNNSIQREHLMTVFRSDKELLENEVKTIILDYLKGTKLDIVKSDTVTKYIPHIISNKNRERLLNNKWEEFSNSKLVITDRLHGMIFAYITGTPAIVFDNQNHKVKSSYKDWLSDVDYIHFADDYSIEELKTLITRYMSMNDFMGAPSSLLNLESYNSLISSFKKL